MEQLAQTNLRLVQELHDVRQRCVASQLPSGLPCAEAKSAAEIEGPGERAAFSGAAPAFADASSFRDQANAASPTASSSG